MAFCPLREWSNPYATADGQVDWRTTETGDVSRGPCDGMVQVRTRSVEPGATMRIRGTIARGCSVRRSGFTAVHRSSRKVPSMKRSLWLVACVILACATQAQVPYLVRDIDDTYAPYYESYSSSPRYFVGDGETVYFTANHELRFGIDELFAARDGVVTRVSPVTDGSPTSPFPVLPIGGGISLFSANLVFDRELWRTDGTTAGTYRLMDIHPTDSSNPSMLAAWNGLAFFQATTPANGRELWVSDGTVAGTRLLKDLDGTLTWSGPVILGELGGRLMIGSTVGLWATDGTPEGTTRILNGLRIRGGVISGSRIFMAGRDAEHGEELWVSDGTESGTRRVTILNASSSESSFYSTLSFAAVGSGVVFEGTDGTAERRGVWFSDGTAAGTNFLRPSSPPNIACGWCRFTSVDGLVYFRTDGELVRTDGTSAGTYVLDNNVQEYPVAAFGALYYVITDATGLNMLRRTDGTLSGVETTLTLPKGSSFQNPAFANGSLYFQYDTYPYGAEPWVADTPSSARMLANVGVDTPPTSDPDRLTAVGDLVYFLARDSTLRYYELWRSDGTDSGTVKVMDANQGTSVSTVTPLIGFSGDLFFSHTLAQLWRSNGTLAGTTLVKDFNRGVNVPSIGRPITLGQRMVFPASDGLESRLWVSDGTAAGTTALRLENRVESLETGVEPKVVADLGFFISSDPTGWLWSTDGTSAGTRAVTKVERVPLVAGAGALYWSNASSTGLHDLIRSDGTAGGTITLASLPVGAMSAFAGAGPLMYFDARSVEAGKELWRTDGTPAGTLMVRDLFPGASSSVPDKFVAMGSLVFFVADDGVHGRELWRTDGTFGGTVLVKDLRAGALSSDPEPFLAADGLLWFSADDGVSGIELWRTDGTEAGTQLVSDLAAGAASSTPMQLVAASSRLFFTAWHPEFGRELWAITRASSRLQVGDVRLQESAGTVTFTIAREGDVSTPASVVYQTKNGTALSGSDYAAAAGTVSFAAGERSKSVVVTLISDTVAEGSETLFLELSSPAGPALDRGTAVAIVEDDDRRADLAVEIAQPGTSSCCQLRITNHGPSMATNVRVRFEFSPSHSLCEGCWETVAPLAPGESHTISRSIPFSQDFLSSTLPVGYTLRGVVEADEIDGNLTNNRDSRLISRNGYLSLPPYLVAGSSSTGRYSDFESTNVTISSTQPIVTVSPTNFFTPPPPPFPAQAVNAVFTLTAGTATGITMIQAASAFPQTVPLEVVAPGNRPRLSTLVSVPPVSGTYGQTFVLPIRIVGRDEDGKLPTGTVYLRNKIGALLQERILDDAARATFSLTGLPYGSVELRFEYSGDSRFRNTDGSRTFDIRRVTTTMGLTLARSSCRMAEGFVVVRALNSSMRPTGTVTVFLNGVGVAVVDLAATSVQNESRAVLRINLPLSSNSIYVVYSDEPMFEGTSSATYLTTNDCSAFATGFYTLPPCRVVDTRGAAGPVGGPELGANAARTVKLTGRCGVPATAKSVSVNVTAVAPGSSGYLQILPAGLVPNPNTATVQYRASKTRATMTIATLNGEGEISVYNGAQTAIHFIIDVFGFFQ
jgi:ELWxxDGT repeat protein